MTEQFYLATWLLVIGFIISIMVIGWIAIQWVWKQINQFFKENDYYE